MRRVLLAAAVALAALPAAATADRSSLPRVASGEPPGPPLLYRPLPRPPELANGAPFRAAPLLVSGTDALRDGEYVHQDFLFDDHGADQGDAVDPDLDKPGPASFSGVGGDVLYPTGRRYAANAADLVELRVRPTRTHLVFRATLQTVLADRAAAIGIGIDRDRRDSAPVAWPDGAGLSSPGLDLFVTAWGTGGRVTRLPGGGTTPLPRGAVTISRRTNQMTIRVPRRLAEPGRATWRMVAGVGLWDGRRDAFKPVPAGARPSADTPASGGSRPAPAIFNLAFRFGERAEPGGSSYFETRQARALTAGRTGDLYADVPFGALARSERRWLHAPRRRQARIYASGVAHPEGVRNGFPYFGGRLQPYLLDLPARRRGRPGLTLALHSNGGTFTQYAVFIDRWLPQLGTSRGDLIASPLARGPSHDLESGSAYTLEAELDVWEVYRDVARRFRLAPGRLATTGYSLGGIGSYYLTSVHPDLFARSFPVVGAPFRAVDLFENLRWVPTLAWNASDDNTVRYEAARPAYTRARELGLRFGLWTFTGDHFGLAGSDEWGLAARFLGRGRRATRDPSRVDYAVLTRFDRPDLGLVHDHAYWVSDLRVRRGGGDPRGEISARSHAFGPGDPRVVRSPRVRRPPPPRPHFRETVSWRGFERARRRNALTLDLENLGRATIDGRRARLDGDRELRVRITSDGPARVRLALPLPRGTGVRGGRGRADRRGVTLQAAGGTRLYRVGR